jgi:hypothetical protein
VGIRLIAETERYTVEVHGATFTYRRVPSFIQKQIEQRHIKRGVEDKRGTVEEVLRWAVLDWDGIADANGIPVAFTPELLAYLPEEVKGILVVKFYAGDDPHEEQSHEEALLGNFVPGSTAA